MESCKHFDAGFCSKFCTGSHQDRMSKCKGWSKYCEDTKVSKQYYVRAGRLAAETLVSLDAEGLEFAKSAGYDIRPA